LVVELEHRVSGITVGDNDLKLLSRNSTDSERLEAPSSICKKNSPRDLCRMVNAHCIGWSMTQDM